MWILIFALTAGTLSRGDSSSMIVAEFSSQAKCSSAGDAAVAKFDTLMKAPKFICVEK